MNKKGKKREENVLTAMTEIFFCESSRVNCKMMMEEQLSCDFLSKKFFLFSSVYKIAKNSTP
jgi:hypothetical protein